MKSTFLRNALLAVLLLNQSMSFSRDPGLTSGQTYTIASEKNQKLLDVRNSSMDEGAQIVGWTKTGSDAQKWLVTEKSPGLFTLKNSATGMFLHLNKAGADTITADQRTDTGKDDIVWTIDRSGKGSCFIRPVSDKNLSLTFLPGDTANRNIAVLTNSSSSNNQKWIFVKEPVDNLTPQEIADKVFASWYNTFDMGSVKGYFWDNAEMIEVVLDALEVTGDPKYKAMFETMYGNFIRKNGADWLNNKYNDDIAWAVLFSVRGYLLTGNNAYLVQAKTQFDRMWARAFTTSYGGGLLWYDTKTTKNACINGPSMVACCYLAKATGDTSYYEKAISLYTWSKLYLFDPKTGKVNDNVDLDKKTGQLKISTWSSTYNQGTYLGAATMLYKYTGEASYLAEAQKIAEYIRDNMYASKVMDNEYNGNDLPGFKGIFARYARMYTTELQMNDLVDWLKVNAGTAYNNRNSAGLIQTRWATRTNESKPGSAFSCSTAVSLLVNTIPFAK